MNISYKWLHEYVDFDLSAQEVADALTASGLEVDAVEEVQAIRGGLKGLVVGLVETCEPHPNSDHMHVCRVALGDRTEQIVCGAPNVASGEKVIVATLGTVLYDGDKEFTIKKSKLRGVESNGMICAEDEIGVGRSHDGIIVLPEDTPVGLPAAEYYHLESDYVIEVDITPNRADACSHYGVARDLYAYLVEHGYETRLRRPSVEAFAVDDHELPIAVSVENAEACPRYAAVSLTECHVAESPEWLKERLTAIGLRPINNIVDITNYIMMAFGQPLHCFDADMVEGRQIVVKTLPEGTPFVTLDGEEHKLSARDLAICNAREPMCIAGVFGGRGSGTYETTHSVVLESAYFNPTYIRKSARRHGLQTDASFRFERGIDPDGQIYALKMAALMAKELAGAKVSMDIVDVNPTPAQPFAVDLRYDYCDRLIGKALPHSTIRRICQSLEMTVVEESDEGLRLEVPPYRVDVQRPCDVVEDVLRIYGYNNVEIPSQVKSSLSVKGEADKSHRLQNLVAEQLVGAGYREILNNSLQRAAYYDGLESHKPENLVRLLNPLSQDLSAMRQTLLFGGLESIARNVAHRQSSLAMFEFGNCYYFHAERRDPNIHKGESSRDPEVIHHVLDAYAEDYHLALFLTGRRHEGSWMVPDEEATFYELKAATLNVLRRVGTPMARLVEKASESDLFAQALALDDRNGRRIVEMGVVGEKAMKPFAIGAPVYFADINWTLLMRLIRKEEVLYKEISKFPAVSRDLALLIDKDVEFHAIEDLAHQTEKKLLRRVQLFDVYEGDRLPEGKKSYAVNFLLQDETRTMSDKQIDAIMQKLIRALTEKLGAELR